MLVVASFSFRLCVFTLNLSAEHSTGMSDASPQAELPPSSSCHEPSLWDGDCAKDASETMPPENERVT